MLSLVSCPVFCSIHLLFLACFRYTVLSLSHPSCCCVFSVLEWGLGQISLLVSTTVLGGGGSGTSCLAECFDFLQGQY